MSRLLLISYEFPPKGGPGVQRPLKMAKYLSRLGWDVTVLTVKDPMGGMMDESLLAELPESVRVLRAWSLEPTRFVQWLRRTRSAPASTTASAPAPAPTQRGYTAAPSWFIRAVQALFIPDEKVGWTRYAVRAAKAAHAEEPFDIIVASGPPFSAYGVAWRLSRVLCIPWVADLRDPIVGGYFFRPATPLHAWLMRRYERRVAERAARVVTATDGFTRGLIERHPESRDGVVTITNGFDAEDFAGVEPESHDGFRLAYVGTFQGAVSAATLLKAVRMLVTQDDPLLGDLRVRLVGPIDAETTALIDELGVVDHVDRPGYVSHAGAVSEMRSADALLLVGAGSQAGDVVPGKLLEYLAAERPILALVPDGQAADIVRTTGAGIVVAQGDVEATVSAIRTLYTAWASHDPWRFNREAVRGFDRAVLFRRYDELLRDVLIGKEAGR